MPDILDENGLTLKDAPELLGEKEEGYRGIYGTEINLESNSPDGQNIGIQVQAETDLREKFFGIYSSFDPDESSGILLDQRNSTFKVKRKGGTFTVQPIEVTVDREVALQGLDEFATDINGTGYTVQDDAGNKFILFDSVTLSVGTIQKNFRAKEIGAVTTISNTIVNPTTIILGVTNINNPSTQLEPGQDQETDAQFRLRAQRSTAISSVGFLDSIFSLILNLDTVTEVRVFENVEKTVDSDGIPGNGIWVIVEGGSITDIANGIYVTRPPGVPMKGIVEQEITTLSGQIFTAKFDRPTAIELSIHLEIKNNDSNVNLLDIEAQLKDYMVENISYKIGETAEASRIMSVARDGLILLEVDAFVTDVDVSDDGFDKVDFLETPQKDQQWTLDISRIFINFII